MREHAAKRPACATATELIGIYYHPASDLGNFKKCSVAEVESFYRDSVDVEVLRSSVDQEQYCREILLKTHSSALVVQHGIVRLSMRFLPELPRAEILQQKKPLGRVLIEHDVLRKIELFELLKIECGKELAKFFSVPLGSIAYGRTAILHCNNEPAIELLEIVRP